MSVVYLSVKLFSMTKGGCLNVTTNDSFRIIFMSNQIFLNVLTVCKNIFQNHYSNSINLWNYLDKFVFFFIFTIMFLSCSLFVSMIMFDWPPSFQPPSAGSIFYFFQFCLFPNDFIVSVYEHYAVQAKHRLCLFAVLYVHIYILYMNI